MYVVFINRTKAQYWQHWYWSFKKHLMLYIDFLWFYCQEQTVFINMPLYLKHSQTMEPGKKQSLKWTEYCVWAMSMLRPCAAQTICVFEFP